MVACPIQCIEMKSDERGFLYPVADALRCIQCGKCEKICPILHERRGRAHMENQHAVAAVSKDQKVWQDSSSGGAFTEICKAFSDGKETVVFGAEMQFPYVKHVRVSLDSIGRVRRSKYVQSEIGTSFLEVKKTLEEGKKVVFSGTPCQVAGLRSYLNCEENNLLCVDFICHGVGSPAVFQQCMRYEGEQERASVVEYTFRNKKSLCGNYQRHLSHIQFSNGTSRYREMDGYQRLFLNQLCLRDCCGETCRFRRTERSSDITIADFNNKERLYPDLNDNRAYSTVIFNTAKGAKLEEKLADRMNMLPCSLETIERFNPLFFRSTPSNPKRKEFFYDYCSGMTIEELIDRYAPRPKNSLGYWKRFLPWGLKHQAYRLLVRLMRKKNNNE